ncbi:MAG: hypothetical protein IPJ52_01325 [Rhodocyclaceae bacterium]|nr:hypothetical protein [Rhodocyclaceae bacterium]
MALIVVLWMLALLSVIAGSLVFTTRTELVIAGNVVSMAQAEAAADAGVYKAISELLSPRPNDPLSWKANSLVHPWEFGGARLAVMIADEGGKVDLNSADPNCSRASSFRAESTNRPRKASWMRLRTGAIRTP